MTIPADHEGHKIAPHDHHAQNADRIPWCPGRWLCLTCACKALPRGMWFSGPVCAKR